MIAARAAILAAGTSSRVGRQKLLMDFRGRKLIEYPIAAAQQWNPVVVCGLEVEAYLREHFEVELVRNEQPELGMAHSLTLANRAVSYDHALIVLLGDKPLVSRSLIALILAEAESADFIYPERDGVPGHPVVLSPLARRYIDELPSGDTVRMLREHPALRVRAVYSQDPGAVFDVDEAAQFSR
jgi:molybdenum cofactor cytidylyltransferase